MPWITLTTDNVLAEFNDSEQGAYDAARGDNTGASLAAVVANVIAELRGAITGRGIVLGPPGTIPDSFTTPSVARARWRYLDSLPTGKSLLTESRAKANDEYVDLLKSIRTNKTFYIEPGDGSFPVVMPSVQTVQDPRGQPINTGPKTRFFTRKSESGIV